MRKSVGQRETHQEACPGQKPIKNEVVNRYAPTRTKGISSQSLIGR